MGRRRGGRGRHPPQRHRAARAVAAPARLGGRPGSRRGSAALRSSTCTWCTTAASPTMPSSPPSTRRRSSSSTARVPPGSRAAGQYLAISLSAADEQLATSADELVATMSAALGELLPAASAPGSSTAVSPGSGTPRSGACRGAPRTAPRRRPATPGLAFAGAWTDTGWPDTMEGAVRSGHAAASAALARVPFAPTDEWTRSRREPTAPRRRHPPTHSRPRPTGPARRRRPPVATPAPARRVPPRVDRPRRQSGRRRRRQARARRRSPCCRRPPSAPTSRVGVPGAVAIELVHNFSLIHDDLMDDDGERRHRPTVWAVFGPARPSSPATRC